MRSGAMPEATFFPLTNSRSGGLVLVASETHSINFLMNLYRTGTRAASSSSPSPRAKKASTASEYSSQAVAAVV